MLLILFVIPVLAIIAALLVYRLNGKKEILRLDLVQFFYAFILSPVLFVWLKSFLHFLMRSEVEVSLSQTEMFWYDTLFSVFFVFIYGFVVIHAVTKSFKLKRIDDPLHDLFHHSEYFHLWLTHLTVYGGTFLLLTSLAVFNSFVPFEIYMDKAEFYSLLLSGGIIGVIGFLAVWIADPKQQAANFMRLMKLLFGLLFIVHVVIYFLHFPSFSSRFGVYWWSFSAFTSLVLCSLFAYKSEKAQSFFEWLSAKLGSHKDGINIQLFDHKRR